MRVNLKFLPDTENVTWITKAQTINIIVKIHKKMHQVSRNICGTSITSLHKSLNYGYYLTGNMFNLLERLPLFLLLLFFFGWNLPSSFILTSDKSQRNVLHTLPTKKDI